MLRKRTRNLLA